jgi:hypothetical protein
MAILLVAIGAYIGLAIIVGNSIGGYSISGYCWLLCFRSLVVILSVAIDAYSIGDY